jgi:hypothetical protein
VDKMPDILNTLTANLVKFADGERPAASKFNAVNNYFSRSLKDIGTVIGDIRDVSEVLSPAWNAFDTSNAGRPLDIVNIGRLIGPASNLNPKMQGGAKQIQETIPVGTKEFKLKYKLTPALIFGVSIPNYFLVNNTNAFTTSSQYKVINNSILFSTATTAEVEVSYLTDPSTYHGGINYLEAGFNVIPDPNQADKLNITEVPGGYEVLLNKIEAQQSGIVDLTSSALVDASEYNHDLDHRLPEWIVDKYSPVNANKTIEQGTIYLKNITKSERYENATYTYVSATQINVSGITLCVDDDYCLLVCGTNITASIDDLRNKNFLHSHDGSFGESRINVKDLSGIFREDSSYGPSSKFGDFPMYLHRDGYSSDSNANNGNNAMRGDLMLGLTSFNSLTQQNVIETGNNLTGSSRSILFGHPAIGIQRILSELSIFSSLDIEVSAQGRLVLNSGNLGTNILSSGKINIDSALEAEIEAQVININTSNADGVDESINLLNNGRLNQAYRDKGLGSVPDGYTRLSDRESTWLNKADIEATAYEYKIEITPSIDPDDVTPSNGDTSINTPNTRTDAHFVTDVLKSKVLKYNPSTQVYEAVSGHANVELFKAFEDENWKLQRYRMPYLEPSILIHYKKEISKTLTEAENTSYGLWNGFNSSSEGGINPIRKVFENLSNKAYFSITGENKVSFATTNGTSLNFISFRRTTGASWNPSNLVSSYNEIDLTEVLKENINSFSTFGSDVGIQFPSMRINFFNSDDGSHSEGDLLQLISRYFVIKIENQNKGISWLKIRQDEESDPEADAWLSESGNADLVTLNIKTIFERLLVNDGDTLDNFKTTLLSNNYSVKLVRTFRDNNYSSLNADVVRTIEGAFRVAFAKDGFTNNSKVWVDGLGAESRSLNIYRNLNGVSYSPGYSTVGNNRHKLIISRDELPSTTSEIVARKFRVIIDGGETKGAYLFLKEDWDDAGSNVGFYNWREVINLALRYPASEERKIEIYINGKKMGCETEGEYKDEFVLPTGTNDLDITELIKFGYIEITKGYRFRNSLLTTTNSNVYAPVGSKLEGSYVGSDSFDLSDINSNTFTYHAFDLDLECKEIYNPFTNRIKLDIDMSIITKAMGAHTVNNI